MYMELLKIRTPLGGSRNGWIIRVSYFRGYNTDLAKVWLCLFSMVQFDPWPCTFITHGIWSRGLMIVQEFAVCCSSLPWFILVIDLLTFHHSVHVINKVIAGWFSWGRRHQMDKPIALPTRWLTLWGLLSQICHTELARLYSYQPVVLTSLSPKG